jgi:hypothetical protein
VLQQPHIARATLLPLLCVAVEFKQLGAHLKDLLLQLLVCLDVDFLGQTDDGLEVDVRLGFDILDNSR